MSWCVFVDEWIVVHTESAAEHDGGYPVAAAQLSASLLAFNDTHYRGRVLPADVRFTFSGAGPAMLGHLELRLPNPIAEFATKDTATRYAEEFIEQHGGGAHVVERGSATDKDLRAYGTRLL